MSTTDPLVGEIVRLDPTRLHIATAVIAADSVSTRLTRRGLVFCSVDGVQVGSEFVG